MTSPDPARAETRRGTVPLPLGIAALGLTFAALAGVLAIGWVSVAPKAPKRAQVAPLVAPKADAPPAAGGDALPAGEAELRALLGDQQRLAAGKTIFVTKCAPCHTPEGTGVIGLGPNLTDDNWLHGSNMVDIVKTITEGVPGKPMIPWKGQLTDDEIKTMAVYVVGLKGTAAGKGKAPEGDLKPIVYWPKP